MIFYRNRLEFMIDTLLWTHPILSVLFLGTLLLIYTICLISSRKR